MTQTPMRLLVEGWRGINHSYALVNQFQLLDLVQRPAVQVSHVDKPYFLPQWNAQANGPGFHAHHEAVLAAVAAPEPGSVADWVYRIYSPMDLTASDHARRVASFIVTELGLDSASFAPQFDVAAFCARGDVVVTPSRWSCERLVDFGFDRQCIRVVPHGASAEYFVPLPQVLRDQQRSALGYQPDDIVLLNIGAAIWNKGIDILLRAFAAARQINPRLKLLFKDQRSMYGFSGEDFVQKTLAGHGLLSVELLNSIKLIPANLTMPQMNGIYGLADCYVSPYRAEGFNMPVLEAMACGVPVVVTDGGATDDFVPQGLGHRKVPATLHRNVVVQDKHISAYLEPDLDALIDLLTSTDCRDSGSSPLVSDASWGSAVTQLIAGLH